jgi:hypothetical protein
MGNTLLETMGQCAAALAALPALLSTPRFLTALRVCQRHSREKPPEDCGGCRLVCGSPCRFGARRGRVTLAVRGATRPSLLIFLGWYSSTPLRRAHLLPALRRGKLLCRREPGVRDRRVLSSLLPRLRLSSKFHPPFAGGGVSDRARPGAVCHPPLLAISGKREAFSATTLDQKTRSL